MNEEEGFAGLPESHQGFAGMPEHQQPSNVSKRMSQAEADRHAKTLWGQKGVAVLGRLCMVGYFKDGLSAQGHSRAPWVKCGEGRTWEEAFEMDNRWRDGRFKRAT